MTHLRYSLLGTAFAAFLFVPNLATAQPVSDPSVMAIIGDVGSPKARKALFKQVGANPRKKQCTAEEWEKYGFRVGFEGGQSGVGLMSAKQCERKYGAVFDVNRYLAGHSEGAIMYCGYESGLRFGYRQRLKDHVTQPPHHLCKRGIYETFDTGYRVAIARYLMRQEWRELNVAVPRAEAAYETYLESQYDGVSRPEVRHTLAELQQDIDDAKAALKFSETEDWSGRIKAFEKTYHMDSLNGKRDLPDSELDYAIPTYP